MTATRPAVAPLRVVAAGTGPPLLLLHGFAVSPLSYRRSIDMLAADYRVIVPWLTLPRGPWTFDALLDAVSASVDVQDGITVVGHSYGGAVALGFAARHLESLSGLVLVDALGFSPGLARMARLGLNPRNALMLSPALVTELARTVRHDPRAVASAGWWSYRAHLLDAVHAVRDAGVPRGVLWGANDSILPRWLGEQLAEALDAPLEIVDLGRRGSGHDWALRSPDVFAAKVRDILTATPDL